MRVYFSTEVQVKIYRRVVFIVRPFFISFKLQLNEEVTTCITLNRIKTLSLLLFFSKDQSL